MTQFCAKVQKSYFLGLFGPFWTLFPHFLENESFTVYGPLTSCKISEKTNEPIPRTLRYGRTHARTHGPEFIGPFRPKTGGPIQKYLKTKEEFRLNKNVIQRNTDIVQSINSCICGQLCLFVLKALSERWLYQDILNVLRRQVEK